MESIGKFFVNFVFGILASLIQAIAAYKLWVWFVTPIFGMAVPPILMLFGLMVFVSLVFKSHAIKQTDLDAAENVDYFKLGLANIMAVTYISLLSLFWGWIIHLLA